MKNYTCWLSLKIWGKNINSDIFFETFPPETISGITQTYRNKQDYLQWLHCNKGIWIFTFLGYCTKAANVSAVAQAAGQFSPICEEVVEQLGNAGCFWASCYVIPNNALPVHLPYNGSTSPTQVWRMPCSSFFLPSWNATSGHKWSSNKHKSPNLVPNPLHAVTCLDTQDHFPVWEKTAFHYMYVTLYVTPT